MVQEIITYILIFGAFAYTIYKFILNFIPSKKKHSCAAGCPGCAAGKTSHKSKLLNKNIYPDKMTSSNRINVFKKLT